jgi:hypothetical protein
LEIGMGEAFKKAVPKGKPPGKPVVRKNEPPSERRTSEPGKPQVGKG